MTQHTNKIFYMFFQITSTQFRNSFRNRTGAEIEIHFVINCRKQEYGNIIGTYINIIHKIIAIMHIKTIMNIKISHT